MRTMYRQGDVVFLRLESEHMGLKGVRDEFTVPHALVLKEGEQTGHKHEAVGVGVEVYDSESKQVRWNMRCTTGALNDAAINAAVLESTLYLTSTNDFKVVHPEHGTLTLEKGNYLVFSQREYDEKQNRFVAD